MNHQGEVEKDRLISFLDAILAVAITFMASQMAIPATDYLDSGDLLYLFEQITVYLISFVAIGGLWLTHSNYFSAHELPSDGVIVFLHFVLMFFVTLFPFVTLLLQQHDQDSVKLIFLANYFIMECVMLAIICLSHRRAKSTSLNMQQLMIRLFLKDKTWISKADVKDDAQSLRTDGQEEIQSMKDIRKLAQAFSGDESSWMEQLIWNKQESIDEEMAKLIGVWKLEKQIKLAFSVYSMVVISSVIFVSIMLLMLHPFYCYIPLGGGLVAIGVGFFTIRKSYTKRNQEKITKNQTQT